MAVFIEFRRIIFGEKGNLTMTVTLALLVKVIVSSIRIFQKVVLQGNQVERIVKLIRAWKSHPVEHYFRCLQCHQRYRVKTKKCN